MSLRLVKHERIGESWFGLFDKDKLVELNIARHSQKSQPKFGQIYCGRVIEIDARLNSAFIDIGIATGFLPMGAKPNAAISNGKAILVKISREASGSKGPNLSFVGEASPKQACPILLEDVKIEAEIATDDDIETMAYTIEKACSNAHSIPNGGVITIGPTKALIAIDIDAANRTIGGKQKGHFTINLNLDAAREAMRIIRLFGLGGNICIDFVGSPNSHHAKLILETLMGEYEKEKSSNTNAPKTEILPVSKFGIVEIARQKHRPNLQETLLESGKKQIETIAIDAINALAKALAVSKGALVKLAIHSEIIEFLQNAPFDWKTYLQEKIGGRYELCENDKLEEFEVVVI